MKAERGGKRFLSLRSPGSSAGKVEPSPAHGALLLVPSRVAPRPVVLARAVARPSLMHLAGVGTIQPRLRHLGPMDIEYIEQRRHWLDITLLANTIPAVLSARGAY